MVPKQLHPLLRSKGVRICIPQTFGTLFQAVAFVMPSRLVLRHVVVATHAMIMPEVIHARLLKVSMDAIVQAVHALRLV